MSDPFKILGTSKSDCGDCSSTGCGTCGTSSGEAKSSTVFSRREFGRTALAASAAALLAGCSKKQPSEVSGQPASAAPALSPDLAVVQKSKGPIMTTLEEFYKMGPGPSSSHTMGPMRITYDFFQRVSKLPDSEL